MRGLAKKLCQAVWAEIEPIIENCELPETCEAQLMAYFPRLKLTSMFGSTFLRSSDPLNFVPNASSCLLIENEIPENKRYYLFVVLRSPISGGIQLSYLLPYVEWNDEIRVEKVDIEVTSESSRDKILATEIKLPSYAREWLQYEDF